MAAAAGALAALADWRLVFALPALGCLVLLVSLRRVGPGPSGQGRVELRRAFAGSTLGVHGLAVLAGAVLMRAVTSSMQGWATDVAPQAGATTVSLFAGALFLGSSLATYLTAGPAGRDFPAPDRFRIQT